MKESDFKLSGFGVSYLHIVGCENFKDPSGNHWLKTVDASERINLCVYKSENMPEGLMDPF